MTTPRVHFAGCWLRRAAALGLAAAALALVGCRGAAEPVAQPFEIDAREYARVFEAAELELRERGFDVDRADYRFGRLTTEPRGAATVFEPWDTAHSTPGQAVAATLADTRRTVRVMLDPAAGLADPAGSAGDPEAYDLRVEVLMHRRQVPLRRLDGSAERNVFNTLTALPPDWAQRGIEAEYWQPVGRDGLLEDRLIRAIIRRSLEIDAAAGAAGPGEASADAG